MIRLSLNQNSCKGLNLFEFVKFSKNFEGVELDFKKIKNTIIVGNKLKDIAEILEIYNLKVVSIFRLKNFSLCSDRDYKTKVLQKLKIIFQYCDKLDSNLVIANPSFLNQSAEIHDIPKWRVINRTRKRLIDISKRAYQEDINIGFEFLNNSSIPTLDDAKEILKPLESEENIGYIIDTFHFAKSRANLNQLKDIRDLIYLIQLGDLIYDQTTQTDEIESNNNQVRLFPGEGDFDFVKFLRFIKKIRVNKPYSIELSKGKCSENFYKKFFRNFKNV